MILVDSSCWVDFYRPGGDPAIQHSVSKALSSGTAVTCGIVKVEILGFIARKHEYDTVAGDLGAIGSLDVSEDDFSTAVALGHALRTHGASAPATDLIIAAVALNHGATLLHCDRHFETIAEYCALKQTRHL